MFSLAVFKLDEPATVIKVLGPKANRSITCVKNSQIQQFCSRKESVSAVTKRGSTLVERDELR